MRQIKRLEEAEGKTSNRVVTPDNVYWTNGEITLDNADRFVVDLFSYDQRWRQPPIREHIRETFDSREEAIAFIEERHAGDLPEVFRNISYTDLSENPPRDKIIYKLLFDLRY